MRMITRIVFGCQPAIVLMMTEDDGLTIDQLAQRVGLPSSTLRMYQTKGLLPPPQRVGRSALYGAGHVARIDLIGRLQDRGFSLASIGQLVREWEEGGSLDALLGLEQQVPSAARSADGTTISPADLAARFPEGAVTPEVIERVISMGMVELDGDGMVVIRTPALLDIGAALVALGFPLDEVLDEAALLRSEMATVATRFTALFERHIWRPFADAGQPVDQLPEVTRVLEQLTSLADQVVEATLHRALTDAADAFLEAEVERRSRRAAGRGSRRKAT